jgi:diguanylate cyclase (GGDEF)-like protein
LGLKLTAKRHDITLKDILMISLKKSIDVLEQMQSRIQVSLDSYVKVLLALERAAEVMAGDEGSQLRNDLKGVMMELNAQAPPQVIEQSSVKSERAIHNLAQLINQKELEYKQIIRLVAEASATMVQSGSSHSEQLKQFAAQIDSVSRLDTIAEVRKQLASRASELRDIAVCIQEEGRQKASKLEKELQKAQQQLKAAELLAETDALTGVGNRRRAESTIRTAIEVGRHVSLIVFDVNGFKQINDTYGHSQGDQLLKAIAHQISQCVRGSDVVCRWGGDEFLIVLEHAPLAIAEDTAKRIHADAFGEFVLSRSGESVRVSVTANSGVAEHRVGESATDLFERADQMLYQRKAAKKNPARSK